MAEAPGSIYLALFLLLPFHLGSAKGKTESSRDRKPKRQRVGWSPHPLEQQYPIWQTLGTRGYFHLHVI